MCYISCAALLAPPQCSQCASKRFKNLPFCIKPAFRLCALGRETKTNVKNCALIKCFSNLRLCVVVCKSYLYNLLVFNGNWCLYNWFMFADILLGGINFVLISNANSHIHMYIYIDFVVLYWLSAVPSLAADCIGNQWVNCCCLCDLARRKRRGECTTIWVASSECDLLGKILCAFKLTVIYGWQMIYMNFSLFNFFSEFHFYNNDLPLYMLVCICVEMPF